MSQQVDPNISKAAAAAASVAGKQITSKQIQELTKKPGIREQLLAFFEKKPNVKTIQNLKAKKEEEERIQKGLQKLGFISGKGGKRKTRKSKPKKTRKSKTRRH